MLVIVIVHSRYVLEFTRENVYYVPSAASARAAATIWSTTESVGVWSATAAIWSTVAAGWSTTALSRSADTEISTSSG